MVFFKSNYFVNNSNNSASQTTRSAENKHLLFHAIIIVWYIHTIYIYINKTYYTHSFRALVVWPVKLSPVLWMLCVCSSRCSLLDRQSEPPSTEHFLPLFLFPLYIHQWCFPAAPSSHATLTITWSPSSSPSLGRLNALHCFLTESSSSFTSLGKTSTG